MRSAQGTEGGNSRAVFNYGMDNAQELKTDALLTDEVIRACSSVRAVGQRCHARSAVANRRNSDQILPGGVTLSC